MDGLCLQPGCRGSSVVLHGACDLQVGSSGQRQPPYVSIPLDTVKTHPSYRPIPKQLFAKVLRPVPASSKKTRPSGPWPYLQTRGKTAAGFRGEKSSLSLDLIRLPRPLFLYGKGPEDLNLHQDLPATQQRVRILHVQRRPPQALR